MYDGLPGRVRRLVVYSTLDELREMLAEAVSEVIRDVRTRSRQRETVNSLTEYHPGRQLCTCRILQGISLEELSVRTGLSPGALYRIEHDRNAFLRLPHSMIWTIARALEVEDSIGSKHTTIRLPNESRKLNKDFVRRSLSGLIDYVFRDGDSASYYQKEDAATVRSWACYTEMILSNATRESPRPGQPQSYSDVVDIAEWRRGIDFFKSELPLQ